jgi:hypothetical protein
VTDDTPKPPPVTDEVIINQTEGGATAPQEERRAINKSWTDPVGGPLSVAIFLVLIVVTGALVRLMFVYKESIPYVMGGLTGTMIPLIMAYNAWQGFRTRRTLHEVAGRVEANVNKVSRDTTASVKEVIKEKAKEGVKELATEHPPVAVVPIVPAAALTPVEPQSAAEPKRRPWHRRPKTQQ